MNMQNPLPFYQPADKECALFEMAHDNGRPLILKRPTGCGKTRFVEHMAARRGNPLYTVACHDDLSAADLIGRYLLKGGETIWVDGPLTRAVREGGICYLDEVRRGPQGRDRGAAPADRYPSHADDPPPPPNAAHTNRKLGARKAQDQHNRKDSFIIHRFEAILSWVESMGINRSVDDDDDENAQKAADDQDSIMLSKQDRKAATRLRLHLDLSPADADHEALAGAYTYPEWNHRSRSYMDGHCRVLDAPARPDAAHPYRADERRIRAVRRQHVGNNPPLKAPAQPPKQRRRRP